MKAGAHQCFLLLHNCRRSHFSDSAGLSPTGATDPQYFSMLRDAYKYSSALTPLHEH